MRILPALVGAGAGLLLCAGAGAAATPPSHTMTIQLADRSLVEIDYASSVPPQITVLPDPGSPFAAIGRLSYEMNREAAAMLRDISLAMPPIPRPDQMIEIDTANLPPGTRAYDFVMMLTPGQSCTESMETISSGPGGKPRIERQSSDSCGPGATIAVPNQSPFITPAMPPPHLLSAAARSRQGTD